MDEEKRKEYNRRWYLKNKEKVKINNRKWKEGNVGKVKEIRANYIAAFPDQYKKYRQENAEKIKQTRREDTENLSDRYIKGLLRSSIFKEVLDNPMLIKLKREEVRAKRIHKKYKKEFKKEFKSNEIR